MPPPYLSGMKPISKKPRYGREDPVRDARVKRRKLIESGRTPGLFLEDSKKLRPEVKAMIDAALASRAAPPPGA